MLGTSATMEPIGARLSSVGDILTGDLPLIDCILGTSVTTEIDAFETFACAGLIATFWPPKLLLVERVRDDLLVE